MFVVRGENVYPSAIDGVVMADPCYGGEHRILITRDGVMDALTVQVEYVDRSAGQRAQRLVRASRRRLRTVLGIGATVVPVPRFTFDRTVFKARRVVDARNSEPPQHHGGAGAVVIAVTTGAVDRIGVSSQAVRGASAAP